MISVKISIPNSAPPIIRQTPNSLAKWGDCQFYVNTNVEECDYWFVFDEIDHVDKTSCFSQNIVLITGEPPSVKLYPQEYVNQFSHILTCQKNLLSKNNAHCSIPALPWMVGAKLKSLPAEWDKDNYLDYDFFKGENISRKKDKIVAITSNKAFTKGHRERLNFVLGLKEQLPDLIDIFGVGFNKIEDKYDVLSKYKYSLVVENCKYQNYWTEKLSDAYLSQTFPFYSGCPNISSYFQANAFETLALDDVNTASTKIETAIKNDLYSDRINDILLAKEYVLDKYNLFALISDFIHANELITSKKQRVDYTLYPLYRTLEVRVRTRVLKYLDWEL